jgi:O-antigen ligase
LSGISLIYIFLPDIWKYFDSILEFRSEYRGIDGGLSGRSDLWAIIFDKLGSEDFPVVYGAGFRAQVTAKYVDAIDNGYIVMLCEVGVFGLLTWLLMIVSTLLKILKRNTRHGCAEAVVAGVLIFILIESFVARYLLAIGNPASIIAITLVISFFMSDLRIQDKTAIAPSIRNRRDAPEI